jgi:hypothetical protein
MPYKDPEVRRLKHNERSKIWNATHKEEARKYKQAQRERDRERHQALYRTWYHELGGKELVAAYQRENYDPRKAHSRNLKRKYKMTLEQYDAMIETQGGACKICGVKPMPNKYGKPVLCVDHDHATGKVRGLLCHHCNCTIGYARDSISTLRAAIAYLEEHSACPA